jgi:hypothetical protein
MSSDNIHFFMTLRNQIKLYHWQTRIYARHIATDKILEQLDTLIDSYVEIYIGKHKSKKLSSLDATIHLQNLSEAGATRFIQSSIRYCNTTLVKGLDKTADNDLFSLRDEIVGALNQLLYLFRLH